jgi:hypothetical protein
MDFFPFRCPDLLRHYLGRMQSGALADGRGATAHRAKLRAETAAEPSHPSDAERAPGAIPDIWPKWTASYKRYVDQEKSLWQEQFDALTSHKTLPDSP